MSGGNLEELTTLEVPFAQPPDQALLLVNSSAGTATQELVDSVTAMLGHRTEVAIATPISPAQLADTLRRHVVDGEANLIVTLGGDGTLREVVTAAFRVGATKRDVSLLALPAGSSNSFCRTLWGELDALGVLESALDPVRSTTRRIDVLRLEEPGCFSPVGMSTGLNAALIREANRLDIGGYDRYLAALDQVLQDLPIADVTVHLDGAEFYRGSAILISVGGAPYRGRDYRFLPHAKLDDGLLDVCLVEQTSAQRILELGALALDGRHVDCAEVHYAQGRQVAIERNDGPPLLLEHDGDVWDDAGQRMSASICSHALSVLAPHPGS
jgi:diacylglycerol kinase (ATP)